MCLELKRIISEINTFSILHCSASGVSEAYKLKDYILQKIGNVIGALESIKKFDWTSKGKSQIDNHIRSLENPDEILGYIQYYAVRGSKYKRKGKI